MIKQTLNKMVSIGIIPTEGLFDITEEMITSYIEIYGKYSSGNNKHDRGYARKLAGLNLLKCKLSRGATYKDCKEGLVYVISNPIWPEFLKIGMTIDLVSRLKSYQMYDPLQQYKIEKYEFVLDRRAIERNLLHTFNLHIETGEWVRYSDSLKMINCIRTKRWLV